MDGNNNGKTDKNGATKQEKTQRKLVLWREESKAMAVATAELRTKLAAIQAEIDAVEAPYLVRIAKLKDQITQLVGEIGASVTVEGAKATYRKGYPRISWNSERLMGYAEEHPAILKFKKVNTVKPNVSIKLT